MFSTDAVRFGPDNKLENRPTWTELMQHAPESIAQKGDELIYSAYEVGCVWWRHAGAMLCWPSLCACLTALVMMHLGWQCMR